MGLYALGGEGVLNKFGFMEDKKMNIDTVKEKLEGKDYTVSVFNTSVDAVQYLKESIKGKTIGFGGSQTLTDLNLRTVLADYNTVYVPDFAPEGETFRSTAMKAMDTDIFLLSANAVSEDGAIINIDGTGNRLAGSLFGHEKVFYIIGQNKIGGTLEEAVSRARNIAGPKNALRLHCKTPCAMAVVQRLESAFREKHGMDGDIDQLEWQKFIECLDEKELDTHCYDCKSPQRICGSLLIHLVCPHGMKAEVVIIKEPLGF